MVVTYSSISTNGFEPYGECVMGTRGTLVVEEEKRHHAPTRAEPVKKAGDKPTGQTVTTAAAASRRSIRAARPDGWAPAAVPGTPAAGPVSRGYTEEMEHFAYCVRMFQKAEKAKEKDAMTLGASQGCRAATARWRWPTPSSR